MCNYSYRKKYLLKIICSDKNENLLELNYDVVIVYVATAPYHGYCMKVNSKTTIALMNLLRAGKKMHLTWEAKNLLLV